MSRIQGNSENQFTFYCSIFSTPKCFAVMANIYVQFPEMPLIGLTRTGKFGHVAKFC